jgi:hypothetical protein
VQKPCVFLLVKYFTIKFKTLFFLVLYGFDRLPEAAKRKLAIVVLYPTDGVSPVQKQQVIASRQSLHNASFNLNDPIH